MLNISNKNIWNHDGNRNYFNERTLREIFGNNQISTMATKLRLHFKSIYSRESVELLIDDCFIVLDKSIEKLND